MAAFNYDQVSFELELECEQHLTMRYPEMADSHHVHFTYDNRDFVGQARPGAYRILADHHMPPNEPMRYYLYRLAALLFRLRRGWAAYGYEWRENIAPDTPPIRE